MTRKPNTTSSGVATSLRIRMLGAFQVTLGDWTVPDTEWRRRRAKHLVALLALTPGHTLHRDQVSETFWPDVAPNAAANSLYQTLHIARRILCPTSQPCDYLELRAETLKLCPNTVAWIDTEDFEATAKDARERPGIEPMRAALDMYKGELLPDERYEPWTQAPRDRLQRIYLELLLELAQRYEAERQYQPAIEALRQAVEANPLQEDAHIALMRVYARTGQRQAAVEEYRTLTHTLHEMLGAEPAPHHRRLYEDIVTGRFQVQPPDTSQEPPIVARDPSANLPLQLTSFVGREREKTTYIAQMRKHRLVTLIGPGGCGKTRLALEVAATLREEYAHGVWLVELAPQQDPAQVPQAVATALRLRDTPGRSTIQTLVAALRTKQALLILDNCEHLAEASALFSQTLLQQCPSVHLLATSREPLHAPGEITCLVPSLALPDRAAWRDSDLSTLLRYESIRLFCERAQAASPDFILTTENVAAVVETCHRLDGMPLAIELAAARLGVLAPEQIVARLDDALALLRGGSRTALTRQQTLSATLTWSHDLLSEDERAVFRRLAIFVGVFPLEAVEVICAKDSVDWAEVTPTFLQLVEKSLVAVEPSTDGNRYRLLEVVRQYAAERLRAAGETNAFRERHLHWYAAFAEGVESHLRGDEQAAAMTRIEQAHENLRVALRWSLEDGNLTVGLQLAGALWRFWYMRGYLSEGRSWLEQLIARARERLRADSIAATATESDELLGKPLAGALAAAGALAESQGDLASAVSLLEESLASYRTLRDDRRIATALNDLGNALCDLGQYTQAMNRYEEGLAIFRMLGESWGVALILGNLGPCAYDQGEYAKAQAYLEEALALSLAAGAQREMALALANLGVVALRQGKTLESKARYEEGLSIASELEDALVMGLTLRGLAKVARSQSESERAKTLLRQSMVLCLKTGTNRGLADTLEEFAALAQDNGQVEVAVHLLGAAAAICEEKGIPRAPDEQPAYERQLILLHGVLDEAAFQMAWEAGRAMSIEESAAYAQSLELGVH